MKWFRFYSEALHDPKLLGLSDRLYRHWTYLLCLANDNTPRGVIPPAAAVARVLRMRANDVQTIINALANEGLIDVEADGTLKPHGWDVRQRKSDDAAETKRNQRDKHRPHEMSTDMSMDSPRNVHGQSQDTSADMSKNVHPRVRAETDSDTDSESEREDAHANDLPGNGEPDGPIGANTAAEVREVLWVAEEHWPMSSVRIQARQWLAKKPAALIVAAMNAAHDAGARKPAKYVESLLADPDFGKPKTPPPRRAPAAKPEPARPEHKVFRATPEYREQIAKQQAFAAKQRAAGQGGQS